MTGIDADAIVIGGGAAGLAASRLLAEAGARVVLVEARDRIGGRVLSCPGPQPGTHAELGAEFIHGKADSTEALLYEAGLGRVAVGGESWTGSVGRELRHEERDFTKVAGVFDKARSLAKDESVDGFLQRLGTHEAKRADVARARAFVEGFDAADPSIASVRAIAAEWRSGADSEIARPAGGYRPMFQHLVRACIAAGVKINLSSAVRRIAWERGAVAVEIRDDRGEPQTLSARAAVVTLPIGVLRHVGDDAAVAFNPELPAAKREALRCIEMGHATRVALWFRTPFWERLRNRRYQSAGFFRAEGQRFYTYWTQFPERSTLIVAWAGGPKAAALGEASEIDLYDFALSGLGVLFNESVLIREEFEAGAVHDWNRDVFSRGAYSYVAVGGGDARAALASPVEGTLFFAGEATSTNGYGGTVNGAIDTGKRAASEAGASLGVKVR